MFEARLFNLPNFLLVGFVAALMVAAGHLASRGLQISEVN